MLTRKQAETLNYIAGFQGRNGYSPSIRELAAAAGLKSTCGIHRRLVVLKERGFIQWSPRRGRGIEVLRLPERGVL